MVCTIDFQKGSLSQNYYLHETRKIMYSEKAWQRSYNFIGLIRKIFDNV